MFRTVVSETQLLWTWVSTNEYKTFCMSTLTIYQSRFRREMTCKMNIRCPGPCMVCSVYVSVGEHPATGGMYMFLGSLWHFAGTCVNVFWGHPGFKKLVQGQFGGRGSTLLIDYKYTYFVYSLPALQGFLLLVFGLISWEASGHLGQDFR